MGRQRRGCGQRLYGVVNQPFLPSGRRKALQQGIKCSTQGIKVAPGSHIFSAQRLLRRRKTTCRQNGLGVVALDTARRAKINEDGSPFLRKQDISRFDIPVADAFFMKVIQNLEDVHQQPLQLGLGITVQFPARSCCSPR